MAQHYVGDLRAINNNVLDTYQLKSQTAIADNYDMNEQTPGSEKYFMRVRQPFFSRLRQRSESGRTLSA